MPAAASCRGSDFDANAKARKEKFDERTSVNRLGDRI